MQAIIHNLESSIQYMDRSPTPPLLPILRSEQQARILTMLLGDPDLELSLSELVARVRVPYASVHREIERAEAAGLIQSRRVGNTRLVRANPDSPYYAGLADVLTKSFGVPMVLAAALRPIPGIERAFIFGSWAARAHGEASRRPVGDIDLLVLGEPDRDALYHATYAASERLGRTVQVTVRDAGWLEAGTGSFHATVTTRPMIELELVGDQPQRADSAATAAVTAS